MAEPLPVGEGAFLPNIANTVALVEAGGLASQTPNPAVLAKFADADGISPNLTDLVAMAVQNNLVTGSQSQSGAWYLLRTSSPSILGSIQVSAAPAAVTVGQTVQVSATVVNTQGQAVADTPVTFSVSSASGSAAVSPQNTVTNSQGQASTSVTDQTAETVTVTAAASGATGAASLKFTATAAPSANVSEGTAQSLTPEQADAVARLPYVANVAPVVRRAALVTRNANTWTTTITGTTPSITAISSTMNTVEGRFFSWNDEKSAAPVAVLGQTVWFRFCQLSLQLVSPFS